MNDNHNPQNYSLRDVYLAGLEAGKTEHLEPLDDEAKPLEEDGQGFGGDIVDATQYGLAQAVGGLAETGHQLTGSEALADVRDGMNSWGKSQIEEMSSEGREAMTAQIFQESEPDFEGNTSLELGDGATNWKTWTLQLSSLAGQMVPQIALGGGFAGLGAKVAGKVVMKTAAKNAAAKGATKEAALEIGKKAAETTFAAARGKAGVASYAVVGTAIAGGMIGNEVRDEVLGMTNEQLDQSNEYRKLYYQIKDMQPELDVDGIRNLTKKTLADRTATTVQKDPMLITSNLLMEAVGGKFLDDIFRGVGSGSRTINAGKQFAVQGATEAAQGGIEKYASNSAIIEEGVDPNRDAFEGVKVAAANEGALGGVLGGGMGMVRKGQPASDTQPETNQEPIADTEQQPIEAEQYSENGEHKMIPIKQDPLVAEELEKANNPKKEMSLDEAVSQMNPERGQYRGIGDDILIAEKQGFAEEAVRLRAAKRNFEMAQDFLNEGDQDNASRFRERGLKIYRDVMEPNSPDNHESSNLFPAEYVVTGEVLQKETMPAVAEQQGETIEAERSMDASHQVEKPAQRLEHENIIYQSHDETELNTAREKTEKAFTEQQGEMSGRFNYDHVQQDKDQALNRLTEVLADIKNTNIQDVNIKGARGRKGRVKIGDNYQPVTFKLVDLDANPSLKPTIGRAENQFRDRNRVASDAQITSIASNLDFNELGESPRMTSGAPTLSREGRVIGGNGRMAAIRKAYANKSAEQYKSELKKRAKEFGINSSEIDKMKSPALIRQFDNPVNIAKAAIESNNSGTMDMSALEQASADNELIPNIPDLEIDDSGNINWHSESNRRSLRGFISALPQSSQNSLLKGDGSISPSGIKRFENLLMYKAFGHSKVLDNLIENAKEEASQNIKIVLQSLAPHIAMVRQGMKRGDYHHIDITDHLVEAIELLESLRASSRGMSDYLAQLDMVSVTDPVTNAIAQQLEENVRSTKALREQIKQYYDLIVNAGHPDQVSMFGESDLSISSLVGLNNAERTNEQRDAGQAGPSSERSPAPEKTQSGDNRGRPETEPSTEDPNASTEEELLTSYSEEDLAVLEAKNKAEIDTKAKVERQAEAKVKADSEIKDFALSGSDSVADIAESRGQNSLFDASGKVDQAASEAATSPESDIPEPTEAQQEAGNYKKGHVTIHGLDIAIENPRDSERSGTDPDGNKWSVKMAHHYGYIKNTEGADGDHVDVFVGKYPESEKVFIVDQVNADGSFDEHKVMLGFKNKAMAITGYKASYEKGWKVGPIKSMTMIEFKGWLKSGDTKKPSTPHKDKPKVKPIKTPSEPLTRKGARLADKAEEKFEDFGQKLEGAKKHTYTFNESLDNEVDIKAEPLSKSFPKPDFERLANEGVPHKVLAFIAMLRKEIPAKPKKAYKLERWAKTVETARKATRQLLSSDITPEILANNLRGSSTFAKNLPRVLGLANEVLPSQIEALGGFKLHEGHFQYFRGESNVNKWIVTDLNTKAGPRGFPGESHFDKAEDALDYIKAQITVTGEGNKPLVKFDVWTERGRDGVFVGKKIKSGKYIELAKFETSKEARAHITTNNSKLVEQLKAKKKIGNHRRVEQNERIGKDYRKGKNVSSDLFSETFGFRGVQFGNYVGNDRRQQDINNAYDGLLDLADVIGVPPKALSLNGGLGLAFGARGSGGKHAGAAHYESSRAVINLTKNNGAGSLAHEWWHALDNYLTNAVDKDIDDSVFLSEAKRPKIKGTMKDGKYARVDFDPQEHGVRPELYDAFKKLTGIIQNETGMIARSHQLDGRRSKNYWTTVRELTARAFERFVIDKLADGGYESDYLSSILPKDAWDLMEQAMGNDKESYPYPTDKEAVITKKAYQEVFDTIEVKSSGKGSALFRLSEDGESVGLIGAIQKMKETLQRTEDTKKEPATEPAFSSVDDVKSWVSETESYLGKKVHVVANKMELPIAVKFRVGIANFGRDFDAIYDQETGETWINANQIIDKEHAIKTVLHETLGHGGVIDFLHDQESKGGKEVTEALEDIYRRAGRKLIGRDIERYNFDYSKPKQRQTAVLEYIAHLAETGKKAHWMHKVIGAIKNAMRKIFPNIPWTDLDTLILLEKGRRHLREHGNSESTSKKKGALASLSKELFNAPRDEKSKFIKFGKDALSEKVPPRKEFKLKAFPKVLEVTGIAPKDIEISANVIRKAVSLTHWDAKKFKGKDDGKHNLAPEQLGAVLDGIYDPVMVFESKTVSDSFVSLTEVFDGNGQPVVLALQMSKEKGGYVAHDISSIHGRGDYRKIKNWIDEGLLRYINKNKTRSWQTEAQLQSLAGKPPMAGNGAGRQNQNSTYWNMAFIANRHKLKIITPKDVYKKFGNKDGSTLMRLSEAIDNDSDLSDEQKAFLDKIGPKSLKQTVVERASEVMDRWRLKTRQGMVDRFAALLEMDKKLLGGNATNEDNITSSSWVRARMSNGASGAVSAMMSAGRVYLDKKEGVIDVKEDTNGLVHALNKLGDAAEVEKFFGWIAANRAEKLAAEGRENLFTDEDIAAGRVLNQGSLQDGRDRVEVYDQVFQEFQQHRDDILAIAEKAGIITTENREMWADEFYVPFYRVMEDDDSIQGAKTMAGLTRQQAYKKLKGGSQNVNDLLQNTIMNFHHLVDASLKNLAAAQAIDNALQLEVVSVTTEATKSKQATFVLRDGQKVWYDVHDDLVFQSLTALNSTGMNGTAMKTMRWFKRVFTNMTTSTPQFLVANLLRDSLSSIAVADLKANPLGNVASGVKSFGLLDKTKYERARLLATGGAFSFGHIYGEDADAIRYQIDGEMRRANIVKDPKGLLKAGIKPVQAAWDKWQDVSNGLENANRMAAFKQAEASGKGKLYAAHQSRDMMDFSGIGAWPAVRFLVDVVPFLNARLQGLDKLYRAGVKPTTKVVMNALGVGDVNASVSEKKAAARFMSVVGALSMATMALYLRNKDDEEYQKLEDWHKDSYWWFRIPGTDHVITIPKPFEVGAIATLSERLLEQAVDDKATGKMFGERLLHMLGSTFAFNPIPQMLQPTLDIYSNKDSFTGRQIETMGQQRLSPSQRTTDRTTAAAELLGNGMEAVLGADSSYTLSPIQIDYLISGYFGQVGAWAVGQADVLRNTLSENERPARHWYEYQPIRRFYKNLEDPHHDKQQTLFYESLRNSSRIYADLKQMRVDGDLEGARELRSDNKELLSIRKRLNRASRQLTAINSRIKRIKANDMLSADEKRKEIDLLKVRKNLLVDKTKRLTDALPQQQ